MQRLNVHLERRRGRLTCLASPCAALARQRDMQGAGLVGFETQALIHSGCTDQHANSIWARI